MNELFVILTLYNTQLSWLVAYFTLLTRHTGCMSQKEETALKSIWTLARYANIQINGNVVDS